MDAPERSEKSSVIGKLLWVKSWDVPIYHDRAGHEVSGALTGKVSVDDTVLILDTDWDEAYVMCKVGVGWIAWEVLRDNDR